MGEELGKIKTALHLMNSMILSGEEHSSASTLALTQAALAIEQLEARPEAAQVRVKPLEWANEGFSKHGDTDEWSAEATTTIGFYWVIHESSGCYVFFNRRKILGHNEFWDRDEAKAAAQADYDRRIRAALEPDLLSTTGAEQRWIEDMEMACDYCGGSGHKDDIKQPDTVTDDLSKSIADFVSRQEPLGAEFEQVLADNIEELYEAQPDTAADTVTGWRDISTAPIGEKILVCQARNGIISTAVQREKGTFRTGPSVMDFIVEVSHWMPLPPAPRKE